MERHIEINQIISLIGFSWAFVGIISVAFKETNYQSKKRYSLALLITFSLPMIKVLIQYLFPIGNHLTILESKYLSFLYGPLLYLYVKAVLNEPIQGFKKNGIHFIPIVLFYLFDIIFRQFSKPIPGTMPNLQVLPVFGAISVLLYGIIVYKKIEHYGKTIDDHFSSHETDITLSWLKNLAIGYIILFTLSFAALYLLSPTILHPPRAITQIFSLQVVTNIPLSLFILNFILFGTNQKVIVINPTKFQKTVLKTPDIKPIISAVEMKALVQKLETQMQTSKIYLDADLTLEKLANETNITRHKLSYILKEGLNIAFYTYINHYRIAEFKNLVLKGRNKEVSILGLTYECGFKGSSSFYSALKKERGITPKQLIKEIEAT
jgi:AraC-like DNA-binding protein